MKLSSALALKEKFKVLEHVFEDLFSKLSVPDHLFVLTVYSCVDYIVAAKLEGMVETVDIVCVQLIFQLNWIHRKYLAIQFCKDR